MPTLKDRLASLMAGPPRITQTALAKAAGVSQASVSDWCTGESKTIRGDILIRVARFLNVNPSWLATGKGQREVNVKNDEGDARTLSQSATFDPAILQRALVWFDYERKAYGPTHYLRQARRLIELYQQVEADGGELTPEHAAEINEAVRRQISKTGGIKRGATKRANNH